MTKKMNIAKMATNYYFILMNYRETHTHNLISIKENRKTYLRNFAFFFFFNLALIIL